MQLNGSSIVAQNWKSDILECFFHLFSSLFSSRLLENISSSSQRRAAVFELFINGFIKRLIISQFNSFKLTSCSITQKQRRLKWSFSSFWSLLPFPAEQEVNPPSSLALWCVSSANSLPRSPVCLPGSRPLKTSFKSTSIRHVPRSAAEFLPAPLNFVTTAQERRCSRSRPCGSRGVLGKYKRVMRFQHNRKSQPAVRTSHAPSVAGSRVCSCNRGACVLTEALVTFIYSSVLLSAMQSLRL